MPVNRKRRRADGTLRPTIVRRRRRKNRERARALNLEERNAWLANFKPGDRDRFFRHVDLEQAVFLNGFEKATGLPRAEASQLLERTATDRRWRKLRTLDGTVVGIGPPAKAAVRETGRSEPVPSLGDVDGVAPGSTMPVSPTTEPEGPA